MADDSALMLGGLSPRWERLLRKMQTLNFGTVNDLEVRDGEPVLDPPPRFTRTVKFGADNGARPEASVRDFALKSRVREFIDELASIGAGTITRIEVKNGLPFLMDLDE